MKTLLSITLFLILSISTFAQCKATQTVHGRVTMNGNAVVNATVRLRVYEYGLESARTVRTGSFGYYTFENVSTCDVYEATVDAKRGVFPYLFVIVDAEAPVEVNFEGVLVVE